MISLVPAVLAVAFAVAGAACAVNPVSGRPEMVLVSVAQERRLGQQEAQRVAQEQGLVRDPAIADYVTALGQRLAAESPRRDIDYAFAVVDQPEPNAFALPGGYVFVTRGLLVLLNSEDELAGVVGHEIGHVAARHSVQQLSRAVPLGVLTGLPGALAGIVSPQLGAALGDAGGVTSRAVLAPFNREQERQADQLGQAMAAAAGWDPAALTSALDTLGRHDALSGRPPGRTTLLDTHPSTPERVAATRSHAAELTRVPRAPLSADRAAFLRRLDGLVVGEEAAQGVFEGSLFLHPDLVFAVRFPDGWETANGRDQVGAVAPGRTAIATLEMLAESNDPLDGARAFEKLTGATKVVEGARPLTVGTLKAARARVGARMDSGEAAIELAWIAHGGHVFQLLGVTPVRRAGELRPVFDQLVSSFRPLTPAERSQIRELRLRIVGGQAGETLDALAARTASGWNADMIAVANGLPRAARLRAGQLVKVAVSETYASGGPRSADRPPLKREPEIRAVP
ncbi:MAG: M48 family metalloprotease [Candidatus Rokubacteria bacterium]|nr:M48 family metalloprotease [Candidatus Rokubacteria bacterium]